MSAPSVYLIRHGETEWSATGKHTSTTDVPLTEKGREVAARLRDRLAGIDFALVLVSPRVRAKETAERAGLLDRAEVEPDLVEFDYGSYEGLTTPEIREQRPGWNLWRDGSPGGETTDQVAERADRVIARALGAGGNVALFAHGHVLRVVGARWIEQPAVLAERLALSTGAVCRCSFERETRTIWAWNL